MTYALVVDNLDNGGELSGSDTIVDEDEAADFDLTVYFGQHFEVGVLGTAILEQHVPPLRGLNFAGHVGDVGGRFVGSVGGRRAAVSSCITGECCGCRISAPGRGCAVVRGLERGLGARSDLGRVACP